MGLFRLHLTIIGPFLIYSKGSLKMVQRVTYRRRLSYNTKSNRRKIVRTPGGKLVFQYLKKRPNVPKCPMTGIRLKGVKPMNHLKSHDIHSDTRKCIEHTEVF